jgi:hypothetical protein
MTILARILLIACLFTFAGLAEAQSSSADQSTGATNQQGSGTTTPQAASTTTQQPASATTPQAAGMMNQRSTATATQQSSSGNSANPSEAGGTSAATPANTNTNAENGPLQTRIENGIRNEPGLGDSHVSVTVSDRTIDLSGTVASSKDRLTAERIAESFDGNRQLNDKLIVTGANAGAGSPTASATNSTGKNSQTRR